jgi:gamma-glutamyltranspeptidase/glutathione hydrolase
VWVFDPCGIDVELVVSCHCFDQSFHIAKEGENMSGLAKKLLLLFVLSLHFVSYSLLAQSGRIPVRAKNGMMVSTSRYASEVGAQVLRNGGNAIDAAVATAFALAVTWPSAGNIGGGGFLVYHGADGTVTAFDFREKAPLAATEKMFLGEDGKIKDNSNHDGLLAVGVPGTVAGLYLAHQRLGSKKWADLVKPAVRLAEKGIPLTWALHDAQNWLKSVSEKYPTTAKAFLKNGTTPYEPGETWKQPDLAATLKRIQRNGRDGFYKGKTAQLIADFMRKNSGIITEEDLAKYEAVERKPVHGNYRGNAIYSMSPPSSGGISLILMLNILEGYDLAKIGHNSAAYLHLLTEAMRRAFADRAKYLGDPDFNPNMPVARLLSKDYAAELRATIDPYFATKSSLEHVSLTYESEETTHFSVVDAQGNTVSLTYTLEYGFGSRIVVEGAGFLLNNEMGDFNPMPGHTDERGYIGTPPNLVRPEKRMLSSMTPTIVAKDGKPVLVIGSPGGRTIINTVLQVILNVVDHKMNIGQAIEAGRIHHQWFPDVTRIERGATTLDSQRLFEAMGHEVRIIGRQGRAMGIFIDREKGILYGAADSRSPDGAAVGY